MKKLINRRGETLTETLVAILIIVLGSIALLGFTSAAVKITAGSSDHIKVLDSQINTAESRTVSGSGTVIIMGDDLNIAANVQYSGGEDVMTSFWAE